MVRVSHRIKYFWSRAINLLTWGFIVRTSSASVCSDVVSTVSPCRKCITIKWELIYSILETSEFGNSVFTFSWVALNRSLTISWFYINSLHDNKSFIWIFCKDWVKCSGGSHFQSPTDTIDIVKNRQIISKLPPTEVKPIFMARTKIALSVDIAEIRMIASSYRCIFDDKRNVGSYS